MASPAPVRSPPLPPSLDPVPTSVPVLRPVQKIATEEPGLLRRQDRNTGLESDSKHRLEGFVKAGGHTL